MRGEASWRGPYAVLLVSLVLAVVGTYYLFVTAAGKDRLGFESLAQRTRNAIEERMETYVALLRAGAGLFAASKSVEPEEFRAFVDRLQLERRYPGVQGIGFSQRFAASEKDGLVASMRKAWAPAFAIRPAHERPEYHAIVYLEPLDRRNQAAIGYDMFTEPVRRAAMERARDTGNPAVSGRVTLVQEIDADKQAGFLVYLPVYRNGRMPATTAGRREALVGFVYSPFRAGDLLRGILGSEHDRSIAFAVYSGPSASPDQLLYRSVPSREIPDPHGLTAVKTLSLAGAVWTIVFSAAPTAEAASARGLWPVFLGIGLVASAALFAVTRAQVVARATAEATSGELRRSEEALRLIITHALDAVITADAEGRITTWNPQAETLFGWSRDEVLGRLLSETIIPPAAREAHERGLARFRATGEGPVLGRRIELTALHRSGLEFPIELAITPMREIDGSTSFSAFLRDITERRTAEAVLRESEASFRLLFADNPLPMWLYDHETLAFLEVNEAAVVGYGYSREEFARMRITDIRPPEDASRLRKFLGSGWPTGQRRSGEWRHQLKDGRIIDVLITSHSMTFAGRRAALVVATDVTELTRAQASLAKSTERLKILHEIDRALIAAEAPMAIAESALVPLRDLLGVPRVIVNLFDFAAGEVEWLAAAGRRRIHLGPGVRYPLTLAGDVEALGRGEPQLIDVDALRPSAEAEALLASGVHVYVMVPMIAGGELIGGISFGDATGPFSPEKIGIAQEAATQLAIALAQARLHERVKRQAEELEQRVQERTLELSAANVNLQREIAERRRAEEAAAAASRLKSEFLANMSHELRTPLNGVIGFAELMHDGKVGPVSGEQKEYLGDILASSRHLLRLINDVLDLSKIEAGKLEFRPEPVSIEALVSEVREIVRPLSALKRISVDVEIDRTTERIVTDPARLRQVLYNYMSNALKFTADGGRVAVRVVPDGVEMVRLEVEDSGIGIAPDDIDKLFTDFEQLDPGAAKRYAGTGLGLALTRRLVEAQGGRVGVRSTPGKGSTFFAILPRLAGGASHDGEEVGHRAR